MGAFSNLNGVRRAFRNACELLKPPPSMTPAEFAEAHLHIPAGSALAGPVRFYNTPFAVEPLNLMFDTSCEQVTLMWAAQTSKTTTILFAQGYAVAVSPRNQIMMQPTAADLAVWLETKWTPLVAASPVLRKRIAKARSREGVNNSRLKSYPGGHMMFAIAGSTTSMRGKSAPMVVLDEVDGYETTDEGHPVSLLEQRAATYGDQKKIVLTSTPTIKGESYIEAAFLAGDQRRYWLTCPHCQHEQTLAWDNVSWTGRKATAEEDLKFMDDHEPNTARYTCAGCGVLLDDGERIAAVRTGRWIAAMPFKGHASFHLSELYSTFRRLREIVKSYLKKLSQDDLQTFWNVSLAETWEEKGEVALPGVIKARAEAYTHEVPAGVLFLTAGVDMQRDRLEIEVVGWGLNEESWSIEYRIIYGDPLGPEPWAELEELLKSDFTCADGSAIRIQSTVVDTGGNDGYTQAAYDWLKNKTGRRIFAGKGVGGWGKPIAAAPSRKYSGKDARKVDLYLIGVDEAKLVLMRRLQLEKPGSPGYCHFPDDRDDEYYSQLTAEKLVTRRVKGFAVREWHTTRDRNEALDCRVYAHAALKILNPNLKRKAARQRAAEAEQSPPAALPDLHAQPLPATPPAAPALVRAPAPVPPVAIPDTKPKTAKRRPSFSGSNAKTSWTKRY